MRERGVQVLNLGRNKDAHMMKFAQKSWFLVVQGRKEWVINSCFFCLMELRVKEGKRGLQ